MRRKKLDDMSHDELDGVIDRCLRVMQWATVAMAVSLIPQVVAAVWAVVV